jgi:hypothetical protein
LIPTRTLTRKAFAQRLTRHRGRDPEVYIIEEAALAVVDAVLGRDRALRALLPVINKPTTAAQIRELRSIFYGAIDEINDLRERRGTVQ